MMRDIIIIAEGGCMQGVFGAGVMHAFQEANLKKRVHSIYASSSGAHNAAYFLCDNASNGSSIYYEDLTRGFIRMKLIPKYLKNVLIYKFKKNSICNLIDIDFLIEIESKVKKMDTEKIKNHAANFYVRVFDIDSLKWEYIDVKEDVLTALKASSSSSPYYPHFVEINNKKYIDGSVISNREVLKIVGKNQDKKIIFVLNDKHSKIRSLLSFLLIFIESLVFGILYGSKVMLKNIASTFDYPSNEELLRYNNVHIVESEKRYLKICTDKKKLLDLYNHGIEKGKDLLKNGI